MSRLSSEQLRKRVKHNREVGFQPGNTTQPRPDQHYSRDNKMKEQAEMIRLRKLRGD